MQCYIFHKVEIHVHDGDLAERKIAQGGIARLLQIAEKIPKVEEVFVDRFLRVCFDGLVIR